MPDPDPGNKPDPKHWTKILPTLISDTQKTAPKTNGCDVQFSTGTDNSLIKIKNSGNIKKHKMRVPLPLCLLAGRFRLLLLPSEDFRDRRLTCRGQPADPEVRRAVLSSRRTGEEGRDAPLLFIISSSTLESSLFSKITLNSRYLLLSQTTRFLQELLYLLRFEKATVHGNLLPRNMCGAARAGTVLFQRVGEYRVQGVAQQGRLLPGPTWIKINITFRIKISVLDPDPGGKKSPKNWSPSSLPLGLIAYRFDDVHILKPTYIRGPVQKNRC